MKVTGEVSFFFFFLSLSLFPAIGCDPLPAVPNGMIKYTFYGRMLHLLPSDSKVHPQAEASYMCFSGYILYGAQKLTCGFPGTPGGVGQWSHAIPTCYG